MTPDEQVDIVNEDNEVIGSTSKKDAHVQGLLHRTVISEVIGSNGSWTLVKQAADRQDAGQFVSPVGGHVQAGETEEQALKREAKEEYGLDDNFSFKLIGRKIFNREVIGRKENHYFVHFEITTDEEPILNHESVGYERFSREKLSNEMKANPEKFGNSFVFIIKTFYPELL